MKILEMLRTQLAGIEAERKAAVDAANVIAEKAETEERAALTEDEDTAVAAHLEAAKVAAEKIPALRARIAELEELERDRAEANRRTPPVPGAGGKPEDVDPTSRWVSAADLKARARALVEGSRIYARSDHQEAVTKLLERGDSVGEWAARLTLATSTPEYFRAWSRAMQGLPLTSEDAEQLNRAHEIRTAMTSGTGASGGYAVPTPIDSTFILTGAGSSNPFRRVARQVTLAEGNTWKGVTAAQATASYDSEAAETSEDGPTLTQPSISTAMGRAFVAFSVEAEMDIPDLIAQLSTVIMDARDNLDASNFATSSTAPKGIMSVVAAVTASRVSPTTGGTYGLPDVYKLHNNLPARHRLATSGSRAWVMNNATINSTRRFGEGTTSNAAFLVDLGSGQPPRLLGDTLLEASAITSTVTTGNDLIVYGDFQKFLIVDRLGMTTERVQNLFHTSNNLPSFQRGFAAYWRTGSDVVDADAFRVLRC